MNIAQMKVIAEEAYKMAGLPSDPRGHKINILYVSKIYERSKEPILVQTLAQGTIVGMQYSPNLAHSERLRLQVDVPNFYFEWGNETKHQIKELFCRGAHEWWAEARKGNSKDLRGWTLYQLPVEIEVE